MIYNAINNPVLEKIPPLSKRILDLGCGSGNLGNAIRNRMPSYIVGVTYSEAEAVLARQALHEVFVADLNEFDSSKLGKFDCIICSHVLEHLYAPEEVLKKLRSCLDDQSTLVVALPNILHWRQRLHFLFGYFRYTDGGLMDRTHFRFFDFKTAQDLITESGYEIVSIQADGTFPLSRFLLKLGKALDQASTRLLPGVFGWQFVFTAKIAKN